MWTVSYCLWFPMIYTVATRQNIYLIWGHHGRDSYGSWFTATSSWRGIFHTTLCDRVCQWLVAVQCLSLGTPVSSTNKTDRQDITEILLKVALSTINIPLPNAKQILVSTLILLITPNTLSNVVFSFSCKATHSALIKNVLLRGVAFLEWRWWCEWPYKSGYYCIGLSLNKKGKAVIYIRGTCI